jgi:hypothetical protein
LEVIRLEICPKASDSFGVELELSGLGNLTNTTEVLSCIYACVFATHFPVDLLTLFSKVGWNHRNERND